MREVWVIKKFSPGRFPETRLLFLVWCKSKWSAAYFQYILIVLNLSYNNYKLYKTLDYWSRDIIIFDFLLKVLGIVSLPHFEYYFSTKMFLILLTDEFLLSDYLYFLRYWSICVLQLFIKQVATSLKFEINLICLIKLFFYETKKSRQKFKYCENEESL